MIMMTVVAVKKKAVAAVKMKVAIVRKRKTMIKKRKNDLQSLNLVLQFLCLLSQPTGITMKVNKAMKVVVAKKKVVVAKKKVAVAKKKVVVKMMMRKTRKEKQIRGRPQVLLLKARQMQKKTNVADDDSDLEDSESASDSDDTGDSTTANIDKNIQEKSSDEDISSSSDENEDNKEERKRNKEATIAKIGENASNGLGRGALLTKMASSSLSFPWMGMGKDAFTNMTDDNSRRLVPKPGNEYREIKTEEVIEEGWIIEYKVAELRSDGTPRLSDKIRATVAAIQSDNVLTLRIHGRIMPSFVSREHMNELRLVGKANPATNSSRSMSRRKRRDHHSPFGATLECFTPKSNSSPAATAEEEEKKNSGENKHVGETSVDMLIAAKRAELSGTQHNPKFTTDKEPTSLITTPAVREEKAVVS
mmetsp:Transcript_10886/g.13496  ORF Transcript_10886/g.13496 Transcript_10886/m.13496 type:complete len:419 (+) Transcript_10886:270-1526(+)